MWRNWITYSLWVGKESGTNILENSLDISLKTRYVLISSYTSGN